MRQDLLRAIRFATIALSAVFIAALGILTVGYHRGVNEILRNDPRRRGVFAGKVVFASPRTLRRGQAVTPPEIRSFLLSLGYREEPSRQPGTFQLTGSILKVESRLPELPSASFELANNRIGTITVQGQLVDSAELEPVRLAQIVTVRKGSNSREMNIAQTPLTLSDLEGAPLRDAVISSEDHRFKGHHGIVYLQLLLAAWQHRGGSTISSQVARNAVLDDQTHSLGRKFRELFVTLALERCLSKDQILLLYLNNIFYGQSPRKSLALYGAGAASQELFGKRAGNLSLDEAATLAGMLNAPSGYLLEAAAGDYESLKKRRDRVLDLMHRNDPERYPAEAIEVAKSESIRLGLASPSDPDNGSACAAAGYALARAKSRGDSAHIYTSIDAGLQDMAGHAVRAGLARTTGIEAALVAMEVHTGRVLAMAGGADPRGSFNRAWQMRRSTGSAIKPLVYLAALEHGAHQGQAFTAATLIDPARDRVDDFRPKSHPGTRNRARIQLAASANGAAVVTAHDAGLDAVRALIRLATGNEPARNGMLAIGGVAGSEVSPLSLASAYTAFAGLGMQRHPRILDRVVENGRDAGGEPGGSVRLASPQAAFVVTQMLRSVIGDGPDGRFGTARAARSLAGLEGSCALAGKTGTGQVADLWFVGFSPKLVVAVWAGTDDNTPLPMRAGYAGASLALPIWARFLAGVRRERPDLLEGTFDRPGGVEIRTIEPARGCISALGGQPEFFIQGRYPAPCGGGR